MAKEKSKTFVIKDIDVTVSPTDPKDPWECDWDICLKKDGKEKIGVASFAGEKERGTVPIHIEIYDKYNRNKGYGTQVLRMMSEWAFYHKNVYEVVAECEHENDSCIMALQKAGFVYRSGKAIETYSILKPQTSWMGLYMIIGIVAGLVLVATFPAYPIYTFSAAMIVSLLCGVNMDAKEKSKRTAVTGSASHSRRK